MRANKNSFLPRFGISLKVLNSPIARKAITSDSKNAAIAVQA